MIAKIPVVRIGIRNKFTARSRRFQRNQSVRLLYPGQRMQQNRIHPAEDGRARRDSKSKRQNCDRSETWIALHHAQGMLHILKQTVHSPNGLRTPANMVAIRTPMRELHKMLKRMERGKGNRAESVRL